MKARMKDLVRTPSGEVVTLEGNWQTDGEVTFSVSGSLVYSQKNDLGYRTAYFADHVSGEGCWEISESNYKKATLND